MGRGAFLLLAILAAAQSQTPVVNRPALVLETQSAKLVVELGGGAISDFHLAGLPLNPFTWELKNDTLSPRLRGHFLCLDRWGQPSAAEERNGMPFHGEAPRVNWRVVAQPSIK